VSVNTEAQVTDLTVNDHACLTFGEPQELADLTAAFVRDGLSGGLRVVWLSDAPREAAAELDRRGIVPGAGPAGHVAPEAFGGPENDRGPITVMPSDGSLLSGQVFVLERAVGWLRAEVAASRRAGYRGLRVALDMGWALRPVTGIEQLPAFEEQIAAMVGELLTQRPDAGKGAPGGALSVLCQYDRDRFDAVTLASVTPFHTHTVTAATYHDDELLRICRQYAPPGIRIAGQLDVQAQDALSLALSEAIRMDGDITVNMRELAFVDVSSTRMILETARGLDRSRLMVLETPSAIESRFVLLGAADLPNVRVVRR
jgi:hypothetical protein